MSSETSRSAIDEKKLKEMESRCKAATPVDIARRFHDAYETFAPEFGYTTRPETRVAWDELPETNRLLMVATVRAVLCEGHLLSDLPTLLTAYRELQALSDLSALRAAHNELQAQVTELRRYKKSADKELADARKAAGDALTRCGEVKEEMRRNIGQVMPLASNDTLRRWIGRLPGE